MDFKNKIILIFGIANKNSLAFSIMQELYKHDTTLIITYQKRFEKNVRKTCKNYPKLHFFPCDVNEEKDIDDLFNYIKKTFKRIDNIVHSIAFTKKEDLSNKFIKTPKDHYQLAHEISSFSLIQIANKAEKLLKRKSSIITLTFQGSTTVFENYNIMGICKADLEASVRYLAHDLGAKQIRINAISAGPIRTSAASAISNFDNYYEFWKKQSLLKRNVTAKEVANTALFLLSNLSSGITGETINVDAGFSKVGYLENGK